MNKRWKKHIDLSLRCNVDWDNGNVHELGKWVSNQVKMVVKDYDDCDKYGYELEEVLEGFENICTAQEASDINQDNYNHYLKELSEGKESFHFEIIPMDEFNEHMNTLYDIADREGWWIERTTT